MNPAHILIVDDEEGICNLLKRFLGGLGYEVSTAFSGKDALKITKEKDINMVLLDIKMPGIDGVETLRRLKNIKVNLIVIMITAYGETQTETESRKLGGYDYIRKPFSLENLASLVKEALKMQTGRGASTAQDRLASSR